MKKDMRYKKDMKLIHDDESWEDDLIIGCWEDGRWAVSASAENIQQKLTNEQ